MTESNNSELKKLTDQYDNVSDQLVLLKRMIDKVAAKDESGKCTVESCYPKLKTTYAYIDHDGVVTLNTWADSGVDVALFISGNFWAKRSLESPSQLNARVRAIYDAKRLLRRRILELGGGKFEDGKNNYTVGHTQIDPLKHICSFHRLPRAFQSYPDWLYVHTPEAVDKLNRDFDNEQLSLVINNLN